MMPNLLRICRQFSSAVTSNSFKADNLRVTLCPAENRKPRPDANNLLFGRSFSDHLLLIKWNREAGWSDPEIVPFQNFSLHPATKALHYSQNVFEGMKAFRGSDDKIRLFRPDMNVARLLRSAERACLAPFEPNELLKCLKKLVSIDADWVPSKEQTSYYLRPTYLGVEPTLGINASSEALLYIIGGPVGGYFGKKIVPVSLLADPSFVRAWPGGAGTFKLAANYGPTLAVQKLAEKKGCQQVLWLFGDDHQLTEVGSMNVFIYLINDEGEKELITPPLDQGVILPGVTRDSILALTRDWNEFKVSERRITMNEVVKVLEKGRLLEMFGTGTACVVSPIGRINYNNQDYLIPTTESKDGLSVRLLKTLNDIQYGRQDYKNWTQIVC